ncbi:general secretion pathway protein GspG [Pandoraea capi]|nr:general secretion pathway protein GspG [Pandoraea sp. LA3]MDN4584732.1 general secretion pathway protein GspG [Pandoraea capi]
MPTPRLPRRAHHAHRATRRPCGGRQRGFTMIELLVTLAIMAMLAALAVPVSQLAVQRRQEQELARDLREIRHAIDAYKRAWDTGHMEKKATETGYPPSLEILVQGVPDMRDPKRKRQYFLRRIPRDPFNNDDSLTDSQTWGKRSYASPPDTPAEGEDIYDVYTLSQGVSLNGVPYRLW